MFDYHMHSDFSADCSVSMEEMIQGAIEKKLTKICFTEHIDYEYPDKDFVFEFDLQQYDQAINTYQEKYADRIEIYKGIELGLQPHLLDRYDQLMTAETFDFVICSIHTVDKKGLHSGDLFKNRSLDEAYAKYYEELLFCIQQFKSFNILGHLDLVKRYTTPNQPENNFHEIISEIFKEIIPDGKGIEINTSGVRYGLPHNMPSKDILKLYKDHGGEIITLGSDAHRVAELAYDFDASLQLLESIGFKYITTFKNQEPTFHLIKDFI